MYSIGNLKCFVEHNIKFNSVIDIGANFGEVSLYCARQNLQAKILAVEPATDAFAELTKNINNFNQLVAAQENIEGFQSIIAINEAVSDERGTADITTEGGSWGYGNTLMFDGEKGPRLQTWPFDLLTPTEKVKTDTLSNLIKRYNFEHIDFIKIDIEGAESLLYESLEENASIIDLLFIELGLPETLDGDRELIRVFFDKGFRCFEELGEELITVDKAMDHLEKIWRSAGKAPTQNLWFLREGI